MKPIKKITFLFILIIGGCQLKQKYYENNDKPSYNYKEVIDHYKAIKEVEKLKAAQFLIKCIKEHYTLGNQLINEEGEAITYNPYIYPNREASFKVLNTILEDTELKPVFIPDSSRVTTGYLINIIDHAFDEYKNNKWDKNIDLNTFYEYVLPYRIRDEALSDWNKYFDNEFDSLKKSLAPYEDPIKVCTAVNNELKKRVKYDIRSFAAINRQSLDEIVKSKLGSCEDLTMIASYAMRSFGLPVAIDFVPVWGH